MKSKFGKLSTYLNFTDLKSRESKNQFNEWYRPYKMTQIRYVSVLTAILYILYACIDNIIVPPSVLPISTFFHLYILPISLFTISGLTFFKNLHKLTIFLLLIAPIGAALANTFILLNLKDFTFYLGEIYLIIIWTFTVSGLRLSHATISAIITSIIAIAVSYYMLPMSYELFIINFFWIFSAFSFGLLTAFILEKSNETIFLNTKRLEELATTDKLTGLYNRFKIEDSIAKEIDRVQRYKRVFSVILLDIDNFKSINDNYGHITGDTVLKEFSNILRKQIRSVDVVGRWGGEEFLILLAETRKDKAKELAEHLRDKIDNYEFIVVKNITASFGVAEYNDNDTIEKLINKSDKALYKAKNSGKNRVEVL